MSAPLWTRRRWLGALGLGAGAPLLLPLLRQTWAQGAGATPRRFVFVVAGNGIESATLLSPATRASIEAGGARSLEGMRYGFYRGYGHAAPIVTPAAGLAQAPALSALAGGPDQVDLSAKSAVVYGLSSKIAGGGHTSGYGALTSASGRGNVPTGTSIDAWVAQAPGVRQGHPFDAVRLGVVPSQGKRLQYGICAFGSRRPAPIIVDPVVGFTALFGSIGGGDARRTFVDRGEILDFAAGDVRRALGALPGGADERLKLERYLEALETLTLRQTRLTAAEDTLRAVDPGGPDADPRFESPHPLHRLEAQFELATAALLGQLTPVVVLTCGAPVFDLTYSSLEPIFRQDPNYRGLVGRHTVCHESAGNPAYLAVLNEVTRRQVEMTAQLARRLEAVPEGDGTMLDHTAIVFIPDNGDQHHSPGAEWPILLMGGGALGLKTDGRSVVYPSEGEAGHRQLSNLFNTLGWCAGEELDEFGAEGTTRVAPGPLPELFG